MMIEPKIVQPDIDWRFTANKVRVGPFDAYVVLPPLLMFLMHARYWSLTIAVVAVCTMWFVEVFLHMPLSVALRTLRRMACGQRRPVVPWWKTPSL